MKLHLILKMNAIFMNTEYSKTSKPHVLILKLTDKLDLRRGEKIDYCLIKCWHLSQMEKHKKLKQ